MSTRTSRVLHLLVGCSAFLLPACEAEPPASVRLTLGAVREREPTRADFEGYIYQERNASFDLADLTYGIRYVIAVDKKDPHKVRPVEGYIGMPRPAGCNWYAGGFLVITLNGEDIGLTPLSSMIVAENGARGVLDLVWHHELADVRVRFLGLPGRDHLLCEITTEPKQTITSVGVSMRCYPSFFTSWHKRDGARRILTPAALVKQGEKATLPAKDNWWAVYYDEIFDVAKGEGEGPCAMLMLPVDGADITFAPGGYAVSTAVSFPGETRSIRLAFWDFKGETNADAIARLKDGADALRAELEALEFTPAAVKGFDIAAARADVQRAMESEEVRDALGDKLTEVREWLDRCAPDLAQGIQPQEKLLQSIDRYQGFSWEVKLAELLVEL